MSIIRCDIMKNVYYIITQESGKSNYSLYKFNLFKGD